MIPNAHVASIIIASLDDNLMDTSDSLTPRTDLDSPANMFVACKHAYVLAESGKTATVRGFSPEIAPKEIPIVDCAFAYECPYSGRQYILVARNVLHVTTMEHNLVPPFLLREAGLVVNDVAKIHVKDPDVTHHSVYFPDSELRIPLALWGIFSYFPTRRPTIQEL